MQGDPGPRLLKVTGLLTAAASIGRAAAVAAMAVSVIQGIMFTSVCRGFISGQSHSPDASPSDAHGTIEVHFSTFLLSWRTVGKIMVFIKQKN